MAGRYPQIRSRRLCRVPSSSSSSSSSSTTSTSSSSSPLAPAPPLHHHQQQQYPKRIAISISVFIIIASSTSTSTMSDISALWPSFFARVSSIVIVRDGGHAALISITAFCAATSCDKTLVIAASRPGRQPPKSGTTARL